MLELHVFIEIASKMAFNYNIVENEDADSIQMSLLVFFRSIDFVIKNKSYLLSNGI